MKESNYKKLTDSSFRIFRLSYDGYEIRELIVHDQGYSWKEFNRYKTKKQARESFAELMKYDNHLEG